ncbi:uncharacterized protein LOC111381387 [Olea europaea var. sylvestris]|uniref:uncharacterized protein LOC111381387 n=1 Tax=Olea europaea var. sylvestris TaxID=158386 RepID=UPI000C1D411C|nr:uncharacterized protein LOC111381387 [Olea europaea var. sylvestris]
MSKYTYMPGSLYAICRAHRRTDGPPCMAYEEPSIFTYRIHGEQLHYWNSQAITLKPQSFWKDFDNLNMEKSEKVGHFSTPVSDRESNQKLWRRNLSSRIIYDKYDEDEKK